MKSSSCVVIHVSNPFCIQSQDVRRPGQMCFICRWNILFGEEQKKKNKTILNSATWCQKIEISDYCLTCRYEKSLDTKKKKNCFGVNPHAQGTESKVYRVCVFVLLFFFLFVFVFPSLTIRTLDNKNWIASFFFGCCLWKLVEGFEVIFFLVKYLSILSCVNLIQVLGINRKQLFFWKILE